jgi:hypothetical protein
MSNMRSVVTRMKTEMVLTDPTSQPLSRSMNELTGLVAPAGKRAATIPA